MEKQLTGQLSSILESITDGFFLLNEHWCFTYINPQAEVMLRQPPGSLMGVNIWQRFPQAVGGTIHLEFERAVAQGKKASFEAWYEPLQIWLSIDAYPANPGLTVYFRDVTDRYTAEQRLREEREMLAAIVNSTADAIISTDVQGRIQMFSPAAERMFRRSQARMRGQSMDVLLPERFRAAHQQHLLRFSQSGETHRMMGLGLVKGLRSDGQELDLEVTISQLVVQNQKVLMANLRDVTQRVRSDAVFEQSRAQLSELTHKLMLQEKTLVKGLAQALHDQLGQTMAAIRMAHETILTLQGDQVPPGVHKLQTQLGALISQAIRQVRQVLTDLRPPLLDEHGLAAALDNELRNRSLKVPQIDISVHVQPQLAHLRWPPEVEYAAFMVAREAVENALRHSGATAVTARLSGSALSMLLEVADNGVGMPADDTIQAGHLGILGMQERAHAIGAGVTVDSGATGGTRVYFTWQSTPLL
jgi:PAS domain S-box-containing protein